MKTINIIEKTINCAKLDDCINYYESFTGYKIAFLIMNSNTMQELENSFYFCYGNKYCDYRDIPIAICNKLKFGEIKIIGANDEC